ncbi:hypothetical protein TSA6c_16990 [Azospirillum sp. TSA6c]|uniref:hypothetical protein n=1 Tax=Azospirillum sp. TSA6c TaxID=709813 RepID=UPI000D607DDD|nr:hypothetical protein [Azospirillum sp. TSA6c]PWC48132.1 hypothetical protein TSA6c_16990 [Azospirillum sp. TSA6c]
MILMIDQQFALLERAALATAQRWPELLALCLLTACAHRERGSEHDWLGTQGARALFWACPLTAAVWWLVPGLPWDALVRVWLAWFLGMVLLPHAAGQNLPETPAAYPASWTAKIPRPQKLGYLWLAGMGRLVLFAWAIEPWLPLSAGWSALGGLYMPAGYLLGLLPPALPWRLRSEGEWGEFLAGLLVGPVLFAALVVTSAG